MFAADMKLHDNLFRSSLPSSIVHLTKLSKCRWAVPARVASELFLIFFDVYSYFGHPYSITLMITFALYLYPICGTHDIAHAPTFDDRTFDDGQLRHERNTAG